NKEKILIAAKQLIQTKGVAATSLSEIAVATGIAKGTLHYYYRSKAELLFDLAEQQTSIFSSRFLDLSKQNIDNNQRDQAMKRLISDLFAQGHNSILIHLILEGSIGDDKLKLKFKHLYHLWSSTIKQGMGQLLGAEISCKDADIILASLVGLLFNNAVKEESIDPESYCDFIFKAIMK
ncbi:MAG TPA: TetR/AcrR family transcriptional regulator, partial [Chitinispirillaceae bacterium]|nr:TetR/AcrR family transcriptional regulator [Chitinispirillaceae bacterium]